MFNFTPEETEKMLKIAKNQYKMAVESLKTTRKELKKKENPDNTRVYTDEQIENLDTIQLLKDSVEQAKSQYIQMGGDESELIVEEKPSKTMKKNIVESDIMSIARELEQERKETQVKTENRDIIRAVEERKEEVYIPTIEDNSNPTASFDVIPLPSNGECYKGKFSTLPVEYLTAIDENIIINPNLYNSNKVLDYILKAKIRDKSIDPDDLLEGDRDAIILFLRISGYGNEYPILATDNETGEQFKTTIDLTKLKYKEFNLKSDENGWFDYTLPVSKAEVKFRFLSHKDNVILGKIDEKESEKLKKNRVRILADDLNFLVENDSDLKGEDRIKLRQAVRDIENWRDSIDDTEEFTFTHKISNELEYSIMSINGNSDRKYIHEFLKNMPIKDSSELRKYINTNIPGINYEIEVEKPESLGGGSMKFQPKFNQFIFLINS